MGKTVSYSYARQHLSALLDEVVDAAQAVHIKRKRGRNVVILDEGSYSSFKETCYLLRSPENARLLLKALEEAERGEGVEVEV
jgi:antitoxin YefM